MTLAPMRTSLVTGGAGFMGSHVAEHLLCMGHDVVVLDDLSGGFRDNVPPKAAFVQGSVLDHDLINRLFDRYSFDYVYHSRPTQLRASATSSSALTTTTT